MTTRRNRVILVFLQLALLYALNVPQVALAAPQKTGSALQEVLSLLPADTESITVAKGPIVRPSTKTGPDEPEGDENRVITDREFVKVFQALPLSLLGFKDGVLLSHLEGSRILLAIEGARHFKAPSNLGGMLYEGCEIVLFADVSMTA